MGIAEALVERGHAELSDEIGIITKNGSAELSKLCIYVKALTPHRQTRDESFLTPACIGVKDVHIWLARLEQPFVLKVSSKTGSSVSKAAAPSPLRQRDDSCFATRLVYRISDDHPGS